MKTWIEVAKEMKAKGVSTRRIAEKLGMPVETIRAIVEEKKR